MLTRRELLRSTCVFAGAHLPLGLPDSSLDHSGYSLDLYGQLTDMTIGKSSNPADITV